MTGFITIDLERFGNGLPDALGKTIADSLLRWCQLNCEGMVYVRRGKVQYYLEFEMDTDAAIYRLTCPIEDLVDTGYMDYMETCYGRSSR